MRAAGNSDQGTGIRSLRPLASRRFSRNEIAPVFSVPDRRAVVVPVVCRVQGCGNAAEHGSFCLDCWQEYTALSVEWERKLAQRLDPGWQVRRAARRRFLGYTVFLLICEVLIGWAMEAPLDLFQVIFGLAWAPAIAGTCVFFEERARRKRAVVR